MHVALACIAGAIEEPLQHPYHRKDGRPCPQLPQDWPEVGYGVDAFSYALPEERNRHVDEVRPAHGLYTVSHQVDKSNRTSRNKLDLRMAF